MEGKKDCRRRSRSDMAVELLNRGDDGNDAPPTGDELVGLLLKVEEAVPLLEPLPGSTSD